MRAARSLEGVPGRVFLTASMTETHTFSASIYRAASLARWRGPAGHKLQWRPDMPEKGSQMEDRDKRPASQSRRTAGILRPTPRKRRMVSTNLATGIGFDR
jgi:hypothetical protein